MAPSEFVVIPMTKERLPQSVRLEGSAYGWNGRAYFENGASHLGIWNEDIDANRRGAVCVKHTKRGWGFGRRHQIDQGQAFSWKGDELPGPVAFEIAVKTAPLTEAEQKAVLVQPNPN